MERKLRKPTDEETTLLREAIEEARGMLVYHSMDLYAWTEALREAILDRLGECEFTPVDTSVRITKKEPDEEGLYMEAVLFF